MSRARPRLRNGARPTDLRNRLNIRRDALEASVLNGLRRRLMDPALFRKFCDEFTREINRLRMADAAGLESARGEVAKIERDLDRLVKLILASEDIEAQSVSCAR
jgi:site-specific DNA recombinase